MPKARIALCAPFLLIVVIVGVLMSFGVTLAQATPPADLLIYNVWVRPTAAALADGATPEAPFPGTVTGAYMSIENVGSADDHLVSVADDLAEMTQLHQMTMDSKGIMRMQAVDSIDIPAGQTVTLAADTGYHVMLVNVAHDVYPGDAVALTLTFADSTGATFDLPVAALASDDPPADDPLIVANALAQPDPSDSTALDVSLVFDNHNTQGDTLKSASSDLATAALMHSSQSGIAPFDSIYVPPQTQTPLTPDTAFIRLSSFAQPPGGAFPLTLTFMSGKTVTIAVPVQKPGASDESTATPAAAVTSSP